MIEYCDGGDLASYVRANAERRRTAPLSDLRHIQFHLASALSFLLIGTIWDYEQLRFVRGQQAQWNTIIHRDIKPSNILLRKAGRKDLSEGAKALELPDIVLTDVGSALTRVPFRPTYFDTKAWKNQIAEEDPPMKTVVERQSIHYGFCDPEYGPPEYEKLFNRVRSHHGKNAVLKPHPSFDIWQFGAVLFECSTNLRPREGRECKKTYDNLSPSMDDEIRLLGALRPDCRPSDREILDSIPRLQRSRNWVEKEGNEWDIEDG
jgi:serine/threonine protein kinase